VKSNQRFNSDSLNISPTAGASRLLVLFGPNLSTQVPRDL